MLKNRPPKHDLAEIADDSQMDLLKLDGAKILILGGTGFVGKWLVSALLTAKQDFGLKYEISIVTRFPQKSKNFFGVSGISFIEHDLSTGTLDLPISDYYVHGSTPSVPSTGSMNFQNVASSTLNGTISITKAIMKNPAAKSVTFLSSGAVFGQQPLDMSRRPETAARLPNNTLSPYGVTKLENELLISQIKSRFGIPVSTPRLFAFFGPYIALDEHFAVGNFMRDARSGGPIRVLGNSKTTRSYMYPTDLIKNLLQLIVHPEDIPINLGSADVQSMQHVAERISSFFGDVEVQFLGEDKPQSSYVPDTPWIFNNVQKREQVKFEDGLQRWNTWLDTSV